MKQTPEQLFNQLSQEFAPKKDKEVINEALGQVITTQPINTFEPSNKEPFWSKFESSNSKLWSWGPFVKTYG